ncbi:MAG: MFS transporter [Pseudomonadota bacterium]
MSREQMMNWLNAGHFVDHYFLMIFPLAALAIEREWQVGYGDALGLGTALYVGFALGTLPAGWLGDVWRRDVLIALLFVGCGLASILIALAPNVTLFMVALGLLGLAASIYHPVGLSMITAISDTPGRSLAMNGVWGNMGLAAAALTTGLMAETWGWRSAFLLPGVISLGIGGIFWWACSKTSEIPSRHAEVSPSNTAGLVDRGRTIRVIAVVMTAAVFGGLVFNGVTITLPKLFELRLPENLAELSGVGGFSALVFAIAAFAQLPVGVLLDRHGAKIVFATILVFQIVAMWVVAYSYGLQVVPIATVLVLLIFAELPVTGYLVGRHVSDSWRARVFSVEYVFSLGVGALVVPGVAVFVNAGFEFDALYRVFAACALIILVAVIVLLPGFENRTVRGGGTTQLRP